MSNNATTRASAKRERVLSLARSLAASAHHSSHEFSRELSHELMSRELSPSSISLLCSLLDARAMLAAVLARLVMSPKTMLNCAHTGNARRSLARAVLQRVHCMREALHAEHCMRAPRACGCGEAEHRPRSESEKESEKESCAGRLNESEE